MIFATCYMRLFAGLLIGSQVEASHFRAVGFNIIQDASPTYVKVSRTLAYARGSAGYGAGCTLADVTAQTESNILQQTETCTLLSGGSCGFIYSPQYIVTDIEDSLQAADNFCYGYKTELITKPSGPFQITWWGTAWVRLVTDRGFTYGGTGDYGFIATFFDVENNAPQVKLPPIWKIMADCPMQTLDLSPVDLDGDRVECEWATQAEAQGAFRGNHYNSITLDQSTCVLTYDGTLDIAIHSGYRATHKPIAVQVKDYDANGVLRSSTPVQFLATVWTPNNSNFKSDMSYGPGNPFVYNPALFSSVENGDHVDQGDDTHRDRRSTPAYCDAKPALVGASPPAGTILDATTGITLTVAAAAPTGGSITRFRYNSPLGMSCTDVVMNNLEGSAVCSWTPSAAQNGQVFNFCFTADDSLGMSSERRCVKLSAGSSVPVTVVCSGTETFEDVTVDCEIGAMVVSIPACAFVNQDLNPESLQLIGSGPECTLVTFEGNIVLNLPLTAASCGTTLVQNDTYLVYSNEIFATGGQNDGGAVTRERSMGLGFSCALKSDIIVSYGSGIKTNAVAEFDLGSYVGTFEIEMELFTDNTFSFPVASNYVANTPDMINIGMKLAENKNFILQTKKCWATPSADANDVIQYTFLDEFCSTEAEDIFKMYQNSQSAAVMFSLQSFAFAANVKAEIYITCQVLVCDGAANDCEIDCSGGGGRRRRRALNSNVADIKIGPIPIMN